MTIVWKPTPEYVERANVTRLMRGHGIGTEADLLGALDRRHRVVLGRGRERPRHRVLRARTSASSTTPGGIAWATWFARRVDQPGAQLRRPLGASERPTRWRSSGRARRARRWPRHLRGAPTRRTRGSRAACVPSASGRATRSASSCRWLPRPSSPRWPARSSARSSSRSSAGYGADAVATRLKDAGAKVLLTADGFPRRGKPVPMKEVADEAVAAVPSIETGRRRRASRTRGRAVDRRARRRVRRSARGREPGRVRRSSTPSTRCSSPTRAARPAGPRARSTSTAASS